MVIAVNDKPEKNGIVLTEAQKRARRQRSVAIAVLLANNTDHHAPATVGSDDGQARLAITGGEVVAGSVEGTDAADGESR